MSDPSAAPPTTVEDEVGPEPMDEAPAPRGRAGKWAFGLLVALLGIALFGGVGVISGTGWFGYRSWLYEGGELYVLNMNDFPVYASVDGFERVEVPARNAQRLDVIGGTSQLHIEDEGGKVLEEHALTIDGEHALLKVAPGEDCLAVVDISDYYSGNKGAVPRIVGKIASGEKLHIFKTRNVVWPRKPFPPRMDPKMGPARWAEIVGCDLFEDEDFLIGYLGYRIEEGFKEQREQQGGGAAR